MLGAAQKAADLVSFGQTIRAIGDYDAVLVQKADEYYTNGGAATMDTFARVTAGCPSTYASCTPAQKPVVARQMSKKSGALTELALRAGRAGGGIVYSAPR